MSTTIGSFTPESIIAFVQQHTETYASLVKDEMEAAQGRTELVKDIADLSSKLEDCKNRKDWSGAHKAIEDFQKTHQDAWGGHEHDMAPWLAHTQSWSNGLSIKPGTYQQENFSQCDDGWHSFHSTWSQIKDVDDASAQSNMGDWIKQLDNWKDSIAGDDKIAMMQLQEDADRMKNLYELGSNLLSKHDQISSLLIGNLGKV